MLTIQYTTKIKGLGVKAILQISGSNGGAQIVVSKITVIGLDLFGIMKSKVASMIVSELRAKDIIASQSGSTVLVSLPHIEFI